MKGFLRGIGKERMHKKAVFYTYASPYRNSLYICYLYVQQNPMNSHEVLCFSYLSNDIE
jgi:hypothetical protein